MQHQETDLLASVSRAPCAEEKAGDWFGARYPEVAVSCSTGRDSIFSFLQFMLGCLEPPLCIAKCVAHSSSGSDGTVEPSFQLTQVSVWGHRERPERTVPLRCPPLLLSLHLLSPFEISLDGAQQKRDFSFWFMLAVNWKEKPQPVSYSVRSKTYLGWMLTKTLPSQRGAAPTADTCN